MASIASEVESRGDGGCAGVLGFGAFAVVALLAVSLCASAPAILVPVKQGGTTYNPPAAQSGSQQGQQSSQAQNSAPSGPPAAAFAVAAEEDIWQASAKQLHPPPNGQFYPPDLNPSLVPGYSPEHIFENTGPANRPSNRAVQLWVARFVAVKTGGNCWFRKGGGRVEMAPGQMEEIAPAVFIRWAVTYNPGVPGVSPIRSSVGIVANMMNPNRSTPLADSNMTDSSYYLDGTPVWEPIPGEDNRCSWALDLLAKMFDAVMNRGGFPPNLPPLAP